VVVTSATPAGSRPDLPWLSDQALQDRYRARQPEGLFAARIYELNIFNTGGDEEQATADGIGLAVRQYERAVLRNLT